MLILRLGRGEFQSDNFPSLLDAGRPIWLCPFGRVLWWEPRDSCKALLLGFRAGDSFRFSLGQKTPGIAQVRYLKQNSRRKDAVSKMTLETRETLEVNINFGTLQCFFCPGMACYWLQTLQPLSSSFWGRNLEVGKGMSKYLAVMGRKLLQETWTSCDGWTSSLKKIVFLPIPTIPGWVAIWGEDWVCRCSQPWWSGWVQI